MVDYFTDLGARAVGFAELSNPLKVITEKMNASDLLYLPGGDTSLLVQRIKERRIDSLIREYSKVIVSARVEFDVRLD